MFFRIARHLGLALFVALLLMPLSSLSSGPSTANAASCRYVLGFKDLHDGIADIVGECLVNEHYNPQNGDALQETVKGLLVWRKADNFTAFTDGYRTWVNGPYGIQQRLNTERFDWEAKPGSNCRFVLGFLAVHEGIPDVVGDCQVNEHYNPQNGDALQETTRGLLVWRKADNFTAFTDGYWTWVNGPLGIQQRLNTERFDWEADPMRVLTGASGQTAQTTATAPKYPGVGYGMQLDPGTDLGRSLRLVQSAGFNWVKIQIRWDVVEGSKGNINWGYLDNIVNQGQANGVRLLFSFTAAPRWSTPADYTTAGPPGNPQDLADFAAAIARRYSGKVQAYEIWNEQNLNYEWGGLGRRINAGKYVELLKASYLAIKAADRDAVVVSGALSPTGVNDGNIAYDDVVYLDMMYQAGVKDYSDVIGVHGNVIYPYGPDQSVATNGGHGSFYFRRFEELRAIMEKYGDTDKQMWFTEMGWPSSSFALANYQFANQINENQQAEWLVRAFQLAKEKGYIGVMFVWDLNYAPSAEPDDVWAKAAFGLLRRDWSPRPAYSALASMPK